MLFPWVGLLEQIRLADVFVHYDDVQFSKGSFVNRVQVKTAGGPRWMTVPLQALRLGQRIDEVRIKPRQEWLGTHLDLLKVSFRDAPFRDDAIEIAEKTYSMEYSSIGDLSRASMLALAKYFGLDATTRFLDVRQLNIPGSGSERVLAVVKQLEGTHYVTGHGAARYLDHDAFEREHIHVEYVDYLRLPYPQPDGAFDPHVTGLDLVANCGRAGVRNICSNTKPWREFINESD